MRVLYLTPAWFGFDKFIYEGAQNVTGLPSFTYPLKALVESGVFVDMVIIYTDQPRDYNIQSDWVKKITFMHQFKYNLSLPKKIFSIFRFRRLVARLLEENDYDFVYVHGSSPSVANDIVRSFGVPLGQRLYGTFLWDKVKRNGVLKTKLKHLVEYLSFVTKKEFLLVTDDGSGADKLKNTIFPKGDEPYDFYYWKNGVSRIFIEKEYENFFINNFLPKEQFIFYCARFDAWKRQDRVLNILSFLKKVDVTIKAVFAGPFDTLGIDYYNEVVDLAKDMGVLDQCIFLGSVSKEDIYLYNKYALASLSLYDVCNVTSVFHEMMTSGALIITKDEDDVRHYISNGENGFLVNDDEECACLIESIYKRPSLFSHVREGARNTSQRLTMEWSERSQHEVELIKKYIN
ncbi:glycosyltransferase [Thalassolituus marinus]|uniref:Glycosyltransferase n=1 Tax=Thalassolituus marinus TaxID=671053 RepID=A0ABS7ZTM4_9GAMM|nr:glycosyltransferase [Thalassolituus marinus]MCA6065039.1 glycosyltransferase [Thalassolituus marinus]